MSGQESLPGLSEILDSELPSVDELLTEEDIIRARLGSRKGSKRRAYRESLAQRPRKTTESLGSNRQTKMSIAEQMKTVHLTQGFYPYSPAEASQALGLINDIGEVYSTTRTLRKVQARQRHADIIGPERTTLHLVREFGGYAADAQITTIMTNRLVDELEGVNPKLKLEVLDYEIEPVFLLPLVRANAIKTAVDSADFTPDPFRNVGDTFDIDYMGGKFEGLLEEKTLAFAASTTVHFARQLANETLLEQHSREAFWDERLVEAEPFPPVAPAIQMVRGVPLRTYY